MPVQEIRTSSAIERVGYNAETRRLSIWFKGGRRYIYSDVPAEVYEDLCGASSAGRFVCQCIKGKFDRSHPQRRAFDD
jgi:hypothetical protein